ncbi:MAG: ribonuclease HI [Spirochaetaceae bacterium]|jgi:ribonuclease HI|nr:ribonuclease HI [Spirochaetaceae bacterium]
MQMTIYTDGSCSLNPGPGGWAFIILEGTDIIDRGSGAAPETTNNRMELYAVLSAFEKLCSFPTPPDIVQVFSDSQYVVKGITEWIGGWKYNAWKASNKQPVKNKDLWQRLDRITRKFHIEWYWIKGHDGNEYNELCDHAAKAAIEALF